MPFFKRTRRRSRRGRRFPTVLIFGLLLGAAIFIAPQLLLKTPLKDALIRQGVKDLNVAVSIGDARAGWLSPIVFRDVVAVDPQSEQILEIETVRTSNSLFDLLVHGASDLQVTVERPHLRLVLRPDGSNLEDVVGTLGDSTGATSRLSGKIRVEDGLITAVDTLSGAQWSAEKVNAELTFATGDVFALEVRLNTTLQTASEPAGALAAELTVKGDTGFAKIDSQSIPISVAESFLRRLDATAQVSGTLDGKLALDWSPDGQQINIENLASTSLSIRSKWFEEDQLLIPSLAINGSVSTTPANWRISDVHLNSEILQLDLVGDGDFGGVPLSKAWSEIASWLPQSRWRATGKVNVAALTSRLPQTLQLRAGTRLTSGEVSFDLASQLEAAGQRWTGEIKADSLAARAGDEVIRWEHPMALSFTGKTNGDSWTIDRLACDTGFLKVHAEGSAQEGSLQMGADLDQFTAEVGKFFDLGHQHIAGQLDGSANWAREPAGEVILNATAQANDFVWLTAHRAPWRETALQITFNGKGRGDGRGLGELAAASLLVESGRDRCQLQLTGPVVSVGREGPWPLHLELQGALETWIPRLRFVPLEGASGVIDLEADVTVAGPRLEVLTAKSRIGKVDAPVGPWRIREQEVEITAAGSWDQQSGSGTASHITLVSSSIAFRAEEVGYQTDPSPRFSGRVGYRADLERIWTWSGSEDQHLAGHVVGQAHVTTDGSSVGVSWTTDGQNVSYSVPSGSETARGGTVAISRPAWKTIWSEERVTLAGQLRQEQDRVLLDRVELHSPALSVNGSGTISDLANRCDLDLKGQMSYDFDMMTQRIESLSDLNIEIAGSSSQPFSFRGPLRGERQSDQLVSINGEASSASSAESPWTEMVAAAKLDWTSARVQSVSIGAGEIESNLRDGILSFTPVNVRVSDGQVMLAPELDLRRDPIVIHLPAGPLAEQVQITPEMCSSWMKYLAPLVADATAVEGLFSVTLEDSTMPLSAPAMGNVRGTLDIHSVRVGPGTLSLEFLDLVNRIKGLLAGRGGSPASQVSGRWVELPEQRIDFRVRDNRVHHERLQIVTDDVIIRTSGSVGLDGSLALVAAVPIRDEWVANDRWLSSLRGQVLQVPVRGTLSNPQLDVRVLDQLTKQFLGGAASRLLEQEIGRGLDRLFGPNE